MIEVSVKEHSERKMLCVKGRNKKHCQSEN